MEGSVHCMEYPGSVALVCCECLNGFLFHIIFFLIEIDFYFILGGFEGGSMVWRQGGLKKCFFWRQIGLGSTTMEKKKMKERKHEHYCLTMSNWCGIRLPPGVTVRANLESVDGVMSSGTEERVAWGVSCGTDTREIGVMPSSLANGLVRQAAASIDDFETITLVSSQS